MIRIVIGILLAISTTWSVAQAKTVKIGLSMDTLKEERWQRDRDAFVKKAKSLGAEVLVQVANGNDSLQMSQAENLLTQGVDVLVVVPHNGVTAAAIVEMAKKKQVPVIAYDRMIQNADLDLYLSFDTVEMGRLQARAILNQVPNGNVVVIGGAPTDHNAVLLHQGQMEVLKPAVAQKKIKIVAEQWARDWQASEALKHTENALMRNQNNIQAVLAPNDGTAGGVVSALQQQKLAGKVLVTGQDADLVACQRIVEGTQYMTIYKSITGLAEKGAEVALLLAQGKPSGANQKVNNGKKDVPSILLKPTVVTKENMAQTVVKDGYQKLEAVYKNLPKDQWPRL